MNKILWIEDDYLRLRGLVRPLEKRGFEVDYALDYPSFSKKVKKTAYDLYIVDMLLPQKAIGETINEKEYVEHVGMKVIEELKKLGKPIIVVTVVRDPKVHTKLLKMENVKGILIKGSIFPSDFMAEVLKVLGVDNDR